MDKNLLLNYLACRRLPLEECEGAAKMHSTLCEATPDFYVSLLADQAAHITQRREVFINLLGHTVARQTSRQHVLSALFTLPVNDALQIVDTIWTLRVNRNRARALLLSFLLGHKEFPWLAATKRQHIIRLLKHALGERCWSAVKRSLAMSTAEGEALLQRELFRYAWKGDIARAREALCFLAGVSFNPHNPILAQSLAARTNLESGTELPVETLLGLRGIYHKRFPVRTIRALSTSSQGKSHVDGPLTALYKEKLQGAHPTGQNKAGASTPLTAQRTLQTGLVSLLQEKINRLLERSQNAQEQVSIVEQSMVLVRSALDDDLDVRLAQAVESIPLIEGRLAVVLDLSASMVSSGERLYHPAALALALTRLLQERVRDIQLLQVGGSLSANEEALSLPQGATNLADALLAAARWQPQMIVIITDGYENAREGDTEQVVQGLRLLGLEMPIYQVVPLFAYGEQLAQRRLGTNIPLVPVHHENGVRELLAYMLLASYGERLAQHELESVQKLLFVRRQDDYTD
jgi:hypothetical protein